MATNTDVPQSERADLFLKKLQQCCVMFDFNDTLGELKGKEIKRVALNECVEYISANRGVLTDHAYPPLMKMVLFILIIVSNEFV